jgi:hypothetical protein
VDCRAEGGEAPWFALIEYVLAIGAGITLLTALLRAQRGSEQAITAFHDR